MTFSPVVYLSNLELHLGGTGRGAQVLWIFTPPTCVHAFCTGILCTKSWTPNMQPEGFLYFFLDHFSPVYIQHTQCGSEVTPRWSYAGSQPST